MTTLKKQLALRASQWNVVVDSMHETAMSLVAFAKRGDIPVVLKIVNRNGDEWNAGRVLEAFDGDGMVGVLEFEPGAMLLEQLHPGSQLVELVRRGNDDDATTIVAGVMKRMAGHSAPDDCPTVFDWARGFDRYVGSSDTQIDAGLVHEASELYRTLAASQKRTMLLHGDLQHYNVLFDSTRGWVAIDPKGVVGELEYEIGAILRNPVEMPELLERPAVIQRRVTTLTNELNLDYQRSLKWAYTQAVLSAIWDVEDGYRLDPDGSSLRLARAIRPMLDL